ncbi:MAG: MopE-related protein, partial [Thermodesulfobacteriota bacterium]
MYRPKRQGHAFLFAISAILLFLFLPSSGYAAEVTLSWTPPDDTRVTGYRIYCGEVETDFQSTPVKTIDSADQTSTDISGLEEGQTYYFAATSVDANDNESDFSETITHKVASSTVAPEDIDDDGDGYTENEGDCNDSDASIHPGATEICGDGIDQDCDGSDLICEQGEDVTLSWSRPDDDRVAGYNIYVGKTGTDFKSSPNTSIDSPDTTDYVISDLEAGAEYSFCATSYDSIGNESDFSETITYVVQSSSDVDADGDGYTENEGDCNDNDASIHPGATEVCGDGIDQDCDGQDLTCPEDIDDDGDGFTENQGDCDDNDPSIHPDAEEICGDGIDQDCDGSDLTCPEDIDDDGDGYTENEGDCNDSDASIHPGATEICGDGIDQDCDG